MDSFLTPQQPSLQQIKLEPFPGKTQTAVGTVDGVPTSTMSVSFSNKVVVTIVQEGMGISQWVEVPSGTIDPLASFGDDLAFTQLDDNGGFDSEDEAGDLESRVVNSSIPTDPSPLSSLPSITHVPMAVSLLGGGISSREVSTHFLSRQIAALMRSATDSRSQSLLVGFGLKDRNGIDIGPNGVKSREDLMDLIVQISGP